MDNYNDFEKINLKAPGGQLDGRLLFRLKVPTGWIVLTSSNAMCFVPDEKNEWKV